MIPSSAQHIFISDLHLSADTPHLNLGFLVLLKELTALPHLHALYILGDWFDGWIGDDDYLSLSHDDRQRHWLTPIIDSLIILSKKTKIYIMHGNRDFAIGQAFCTTFGGQLIKEPYLLHHHNTTYRLEHGDALCTDDKKYQRYRKIIRHRWVMWLLLKQPLTKRRQLAQNIKRQSYHDKAQKSSAIMDVNAQAVSIALSDCDVLIHGHTHRPDVHVLGDKVRFVLGDWQDDGQIFAIIGILGDDGLTAHRFCVDL
ncbi:MAG: UDP-2,3-diacylglucosamine diphosphatase [Moraxella sp.]|nr:UDP-2,3-diacylglucosamine diphosphatase [Moraxella sp.]